MIQVKNSTQYYINERALTFSENDLDDPSRVAVSLVSGTVILVHVPGTIDYASDGNYERWTLKGYSTRLVNSAAHYVYARLNRSDKNALVVFSVKNYNIDGSITTVTGKDEEGNDITETSDPSADYFFIRIGELTATDLLENPTVNRELTYDSGLLSTDKGNSEAGVGDMWELLRNTTPWLIRAKQWLADFTVKGFIKLIGGLKFSKGKEGDEKVITDIKRSIDDAPEFMVDENDVIIKDEEGNPIPNPDYVPVNDETIPTTKYIQSKSDDRYLKKYEPDETEHLIKFTKSGIECGEYNEGALVSLGGSGTKFDGLGYGEMNGLRLREFLEVPELRFNRIDVISGIIWNSVAFGLIETVKITGDESGVCTLKLEDGERSGLHVEDICMGIFCDFGDGNGSASVDASTNETIDLGDDANGFPKMYGFSTSYFSPTGIVQNDENGFAFEYSLQPGTTMHPKPSMKFAVYGNFSDPNRQASAYSCRTYQRYLNNVDGYKIVPDKHIFAHFGKLDGLTIGGKTMTGYGSYQHNVYLTGSNYEFTPQQKKELKGEDAYSVTLSDFVGIIRIDETGKIIGEQYMLYNVVTGEENVVTEDASVVASGYLLRTRIQATRGTKELVFSDTAKEGTYTASISPVGCVAELTDGNIYISEITDTEYCYIGIAVNCEDVMSFPLTYQVKMVKDGSVAFEAWVFARSTKTPDAPSGGTYESPMPDPNPADDGTEWHDGIPDGKLQVWMSSRIFTADGEYPQQDDWSTPRPMTDTADFVQVFHEVMEDPAQQPELPTVAIDTVNGWTPDNGWTEDPTPTSAWMATNVCRNGVWMGWKVAKIKGESGLDALVLVSSVSTISRNSFGSYEPSTILVRAMRGGVEEETNITMYGVTQDNEAVVPEGFECAARSSIEVDVSKLYALNYRRLVFRAYEGMVNDYYNETSIAETSVAFVGDGSSGPMPRNRGEFDSSESTYYYYNNEYRDFVWATTSSGTNVYMRDGFGYDEVMYPEQDTGGGIPGSLGLDERYWVEVPRTVMTAIDTALIDTANIAGFMFKNGKMVSQEQGKDATMTSPDNAKIILDGSTGYFKCVDAEVDGDIVAGALSLKTLVSYEGGDLSGYSMAYGHGTFTLPSAGVYNREIRLFSPGLSRTDYLYPMYIQPASGDYFQLLDENGEYLAATREPIQLDWNRLYTIFGSGSYWYVAGSKTLGEKSIVDSVLSTTSDNPVQNKVITVKINELEGKLGSNIVKPDDGVLPDDPDPNTLYIL